MPQRIKMSQRLPEERKKDFEEIELGYTQDEMLSESKRCMQCKKPMCVQGCPIRTDIPDFIKYLIENNPMEALKILNRKNNLPSVCGRVCPNKCESNCILAKKSCGISIGHLERYAADNAVRDIGGVAKFEANNVKIAIVGSGPAGLACGSDLLKMGYDITVYESLHDSGGILRYGIPEFRLPKKVLDREIDYLKKLGMKIVLNTLIGRTKTINELFDENYKAVFIAVGAGFPVFPKIAGENLNNVYCANEFLMRVNLMRSFDFPNYDTPVYKGKNVVVVGGGNTAMDSARTAVRLEAKSVRLIYRRTENEMLAAKEERLPAKEEGVEFITLTNPIRLIGDKRGCVKAIECVKMQLGEPDESGRSRPCEIKGSNHLVVADMVVLALGVYPNPILSSSIKGLNIDKRGSVAVDDNFMTSIPGVFAGGDIVDGNTVIEAMAMGKKAAIAMADYIKNK